MDLKRALSTCLDALLERASAVWKGWEKEDLTSLVRVLDLVAVAPLSGLDAGVKESVIFPVMPG